MSITYTLYSESNPKGEILAKVFDESQAYLLESYYLKMYRKEAFEVTKKVSRKKEVHLLGSYIKGEKAND
jgi:hypothetical protein